MWSDSTDMFILPVITRSTMTAAPFPRSIKRFFRAILLLTCVTVLPQDLNAQGDLPFYYPPGLRFDLPRDTWEARRPTYEEAMWYPQQRYLSSEAEKVDIRFVCQLPESMEISMDSLDAFVESLLRYEGATFQKEHLHGFTCYLLTPSENSPGKYRYEAHAVHAWGYCVALSMTIQAKNQGAADEKFRAVINKTHMGTPTELDKAIGLPFPASTDLDSLYNARVADIRRAAKGKYPDDEIDAYLARMKREDLIGYALYEHSWERCYRLRNQLRQGEFSLDEALNHHFLKINTRDMDYYAEWMKSEAYHIDAGVNKVIQRSLAPAIDTSRFDYFFTNSEKFFDQGKTYYWATAHAKDSTGCLLICYWREAGKWMLHHRALALPWKSESYRILDHLPYVDEDPHFATGKPDLPKQHQLNTLQAVGRASDPYKAQEWAFNAYVPQSNTIALPAWTNANTEFDVTYIISDIHYLNERAHLSFPSSPPNVRDTTRFEVVLSPEFEAQFTMETIKADTVLTRQVCDGDDELKTFLTATEEDDVESDYLPEATRADWQRRTLFAAATLKSAKILPARRLYVPEPQFGDLDGNGKEELLLYKVSNGQLLDYIVLEGTPEGLNALTKSKSWEVWIVQTEFYKALARMSLMQENLLARW